MDYSDRKYSVAFRFSTDRQDDLKTGIYTETAGKRLIKAELELDPDVDNGSGDVRYHTDDPIKMLELLKLAFTIADGGWWTMKPMPKGENVFHIHLPR